MRTEKIEKPGGGRLSVQRARDDITIVRFGKVLRRDKTAKYRMVRLDPANGNHEDVSRGHIPKKGYLRLKLPHFENYVIVAAGEKSAGLISTAELNLQAPFVISMDAPPVDWADVRAKEAAMKERAENAPKTDPLSLAVHLGIKQ